MKPLYNYNSNKIKLIKSQELLLYILASGITYKEAALMLGVSYNTAKTRIKTLYAKLQVSNRNELILKALNLKLIDSRNIKPKFRKRFLSHEADRQAVLLEPLTAEEIKFLKLASSGTNIKNIIELLSLSGIYHTRVLKASICYKLQAKNITQAVKFARVLEII